MAKKTPKKEAAKTPVKKLSGAQQLAAAGKVGILVSCTPEQAHRWTVAGAIAGKPRVHWMAEALDEAAAKIVPGE